MIFITYQANGSSLPLRRSPVPQALRGRRCYALVGVGCREERPRRGHPDDAHHPAVRHVHTLDQRRHQPLELCACRSNDPRGCRLGWSAGACLLVSGKREIDDFMTVPRSRPG